MKDEKVTNSYKYEWIAMYGINRTYRAIHGEERNCARFFHGELSNITTTKDGIMDISIDGILEECIIPDKEIDGVILDTEKIGDKVRLKGFKIITPELTFEEAIYYTKGKVNIFSAYISAIQEIPIRTHLVNITKKGESREMTRTATINANVCKPEKLDLNKIPFQDKKLVRQLSHFGRALDGDIIDKIREYWQVIEDEESPEPDEFVNNHSWVRNFVSHPIIRNYDSWSDKEISCIKKCTGKIFRRSSKKKTKFLGRDYIDPSSPKDMIGLKQELIAIEEKAREIIRHELKLI